MTIDYRCSQLLAVLSTGAIALTQRFQNSNLSPAEWEVMKTLWSAGPLAARDVFSALPADSKGTPARGWAYRTVKTLLSRLVAKQAVTYQQIGNSYLYTAAVEREAMTRQEVGGLLDRLISQGERGSFAVLSTVLARFLGDAEITEIELQEIEALLDKKRCELQKKNSKKKGS